MTNRQNICAAKPVTLPKWLPRRHTRNPNYGPTSMGSPTGTTVTVTVVVVVVVVVVKVVVP